MTPLRLAAGYTLLALLLALSLWAAVTTSGVRP